MCAGQLGHGAAVPSTPARHRRAHPALDACLASAAGTGTPAEPGRDALQQARTGPDPVAVGTTASTALTFLAMQKIPKFRAASPNLAFFFFFFASSPVKIAGSSGLCAAVCASGAKPSLVHCSGASLHLPELRHPMSTGRVYLGLPQGLRAPTHIFPAPRTPTQAPHSTRHPRCLPPGIYLFSRCSMFLIFLIQL